MALMCGCLAFKSAMGEIDVFFSSVYFMQLFYVQVCIASVHVYMLKCA